MSQTDGMYRVTDRTDRRYVSGVPATNTRSRRTQQERTEATTGQLVAAARELFAREGYAGTSLEAIVAECGVTKGALYHHFAGKREIFEAVYRAEEQRICEALARAAARRSDPVEAMHAGARGFLEVCLDPGVQRITLLDAPGVLGWERMREIEWEFGLALIKQALVATMDAGRMRKRDPEALAYLIFGALCEGAMFVARAADQSAAKRSFERELKALVNALTS
jgi:AcrR family transcriptional regulator